MGKEKLIVSQQVASRINFLFDRKPSCIHYQALLNASILFDLLVSCPKDCKFFKKREGDLVNTVLYKKNVVQLTLKSKPGLVTDCTKNNRWFKCKTCGKATHSADPDIEECFECRGSNRRYAREYYHRVVKNKAKEVKDNG